MKNIKKIIITVFTVLSVTSPLNVYAVNLVQASSINEEFIEETIKNTESFSKLNSKENTINEGWNTINGYKYYYDSDMKKITGWKEIDHKNYYFDSNGILKIGWIPSGDRWYYTNSDGSRVSNEWIIYNNKKYYLLEDGVMASGITKINDNFYYFTPNGDMFNQGWIHANNNDDWYYFTQDGIMKTGWLTDNNKKYYLNDTGIMTVGWKNIDNKSYYFDKNGAMKTGWISIGTDVFFLDNTGEKIVNTTINGYALDENGKLILNNGDTTFDVDKYFVNNNITIDLTESNYKSTTHGITEDVFNGIDISNYDGYVDFNAVKQCGIKAVYMKASESNYFVDQYCAGNSVNAKKAGLKVGYYHFLKGNTSPEEQAQLFYNCIKDKPNDLKPCIDVEVDPSTACEYTIRFINEFKKLSNMDVVIYTYSNFINNFDSRLSQYSLWEANYNNTPFSLPTNKIWTNRAGHQYSAKGTVPGVNAQEVDMNVFNHNIFLQ